MQRIFIFLGATLNLLIKIVRLNEAVVQIENSTAILGRARRTVEAVSERIHIFFYFSLRNEKKKSSTKVQASQTLRADTWLPCLEL